MMQTFMTASSLSSEGSCGCVGKTNALPESPCGFRRRIKPNTQQALHAFFHVSKSDRVGTFSFRKGTVLHVKKFLYASATNLVQLSGLAKLTIVQPVSLMAFPQKLC